MKKNKESGAMGQSEQVKSKIKFVGLHAHSVYSVFDGLGYPSEHMDFAYANGCDALALTDHGSMNGLVEQVLHAKKMKEAGKDFKAIYGVEAYFHPDLKSWKSEKEKIAIANKAKKGRKKKDEGTSGLSIEDEEDTKKKNKNIVNRRAHMILLAQNQEGLNNLFQIISQSYTEDNFYRFPRIDYDLLEKHSEGIIATSACLGGEYSQAYWRHKDEGDEAVLDAMRETTKRMVTIFGKRWYAELQWNSIPEQHDVNSLIIKIAKEFDLQLISTADSHYPDPESWRSRLVYRKLGWMGGKDINIDDIPKSVEEVGYELYPKNGDQMWSAYKEYSKEVGAEYDDELILKSIELTHEIAHNIIENFTPDTTIRLPDFVVPEGKTADETLSELVEIGLRKVFRIKNKKENIYRVTRAYSERVKYELSVIKKLNFAKYFLTMNAVAEKAVKVQLTAPGRGSAAGSIVSYALGITQVDPIKYNLQFERFLRADATDMPDIDFDVANPAELKDLLIEDWGSNRVVPITNWNTLQLKSLLKDISKLYNIPFTEVNVVTGKMIAEATPAAKKANGIKAGIYTPTFDEVKKYSDTLRAFLEEYPHVERYINSLHGSIKSQSKHAGGCVIGEELNKYMPLVSGKGVRQTPWSEGQNVRHLEPMGFIKFDILGLTTLEMINGAVRRILKRHLDVRSPTFNDIRKFYDEKLHPDVIDLGDQKVYEDVFHEGKWGGIFQFTGSGAQNFCKKVKPRSIIDISAVTSIFRPAALSMNVDKLYVAARADPASVKYLHPLHKEVTEETYGFLVFQEQIALLAHKLGKGITLNDGNVFRKVLTKKGTGKADKVLAEIKPKFLEGCIEKGISRKDATELYRSCELWAGYGFNASHAVSYSIVSFQCAWLLAYYPAEWLAAFLDAQGETKKEEANNIVKKLGFSIREVEINKSGAEWGIDGETLIQPLNAIKGVGSTAIREIINYRPFNDVESLLFHERVSYAKLNKKNLDVLCRSGALASLIDDRFTGAKHFWSCVAVDRPRNREQLEANIKLYAPEGEFSREEKILNQIQLTGEYPIGMVLGKTTKERLKEHRVPPLALYDPAIEVAWFIPKAITIKKTAKGNDYAILEVIDDTNTVTKIKCWGYDKEKDLVRLNRPYMAKLDYSEQWGFSTRSIRLNLKLLG